MLFVIGQFAKGLEICFFSVAFFNPQLSVQAVRLGSEVQKVRNQSRFPFQM